MSYFIYYFMPPFIFNIFGTFNVFICWFIYLLSYFWFWQFQFVSQSVKISFLPIESFIYVFIFYSGNVSLP